MGIHGEFRIAEKEKVEQQRRTAELIHFECNPSLDAYSGIVPKFPRIPRQVYENALKYLKENASWVNDKTYLIGNCLVRIDYATGYGTGLHSIDIIAEQDERNKAVTLIGKLNLPLPK